MADEADLAGEMAARYLNGDLSARKRAAIISGSGTIECIDCGIEIPLVRRKACPGCLRCVDCQAEAE
jgi:phage/conjugal plasmid C-4 type zinc finger TraR family protein